ncbi:bifunctional diguanylate cyclase/phosphodiesterase [Ideonella sp. A 288]|uniref:putative bifunctional diguanylate cyclase/phosphodiesterase n=1 Tax=Ideonella sp. A 288 TaxID=1962181 RepID=UPI0013037720|nr:EAL domain-containing protein [Ideonella sp. A 288]
MAAHPGLSPGPMRRSPPFRLTRYFSITSLVGLVLVTIVLIGVYRTLTERHLVDHEGRANADLTRALANTLWGQYGDFVIGSVGRTRADLLADPRLAALRTDVLTRVSGLSVAKIKVYNVDGLTVFSSDEGQIGENKRDNDGFRAALSGTVASHITYRERFDAFEGVLNKRNLIASYVPLRPTPGGAAEGVVEVYSDVTDLLQRQSTAQWQVAAAVVGALSTLYLFLFMVVRKADGIISRQERERAAREEEVRHQAYHDALTGLPNRAYFAERLSEAISASTRHGHTGALMFIDLDRFKIVNDSLGHDAGDALLKAVSARIRGCLRDSDLLFRMGGDEFTAILAHIEAPEDATHVARRILEAVARPVRVHEHELVVGATIGIAVYPGDGEDADTVLKNADAAMYSAKDAGRGTHAFYRAEMNRRAMQRLTLETDLQKGFREGEFSLHYQPRLDTATQRVVALEALMRWHSPSRGLVLPGEFIGVMEDTGMMTIVGEWVLRSACTQIRRWLDAGVPALRVSVNVSSVQFQSPGFVPMVERVLSDSGVPPALVELELTESLLIGQPDPARATIEALKALGVRIAIDDFGTGYSALNYLRHFAVDYLKIDRSFVTDIATNARDRAVARSITELARALGIIVVAEGVETEAQADFFRGIHCGEMQGFLFGRPLPIEQVQRLLDSERSSGTSQGMGSVVA